MLSLISILFSLLLVSQLASADPTYETSTVFQFPNTSFVVIENLAVRSNGVILFNTITGSRTYALDPSETNPQPILVASYDGASGALGIAEVFPDVFAVVAGNYTPARVGVPGSFSVWLVNLRKPGAPVVTKITNIPGANALNSMTAVPGSDGLVLIADSILGSVWSLNVTSGSYQIVITDPLMAKSATSPIGINGLKVQKRNSGNELFFTNSALSAFASVKIFPTGLAKGPAEVIATPFVPNPPFPGYPINIYDDFAIDGNGKFWIANHPNSITRVGPGGNQQFIVGGAAIVQPTSVAFGRSSEEEECSLYVVGAGTFTSPTNIVSGAVVRVKVC